MHTECKGQVPNAPCGVESMKLGCDVRVEEPRFLMHRVELKDDPSIPVIPESALFLMHRVELKAISQLIEKLLHTYLSS